MQEIREIKYQPLTIPKLRWERSSFPDTYGELIVQPLARIRHNSGQFLKTGAFIFC